MGKLSFKSVSQGLILMGIYILAGRMGVRAHLTSGFAPFAWIPSGIALATLILWDMSLWPWIFAASLALSLSLRSSPATAIALSAANTLECLLGAYLLKKIAGPRPTFSKVREVLAFIVLIMGLSVFLGVSLQMGAFYLTGFSPVSGFFPTWRSWWLGSAMGDLAVAVLCIAWRNDIRFRLEHYAKLKWEALFLALAIGLTSVFIYTPLSNYNHSLIIKPYFLFSLMIWASIRFDLLGAVYVNLIIVLCVTCGELCGFVPTAAVSDNERMVIHQLLAAALGITGLVLAAAIREKEDAVEARNEFLSIASHELRTPLTSLSLQLGLFKKDLSGKQAGNLPPQSELSDFVRGTGKQVGRLTQIVDQLLDVSRLERSEILLRREDVDLSGLIHNLLDRLSGDLDKARCQVELSLPSSAVGRWDPFRTEQVFENIISNAMKYAPGSPLRISAAERGGYVEIVFSDQGPGIEESKQKLIFERFVRGRVSSHVQGLGLGLFITRQIVEAHGGDIWVHSHVGQGSQFHVRMPLKNQAFAGAKIASPIP